MPGPSCQKQIPRAGGAQTSRASSRSPGHVVAGGAARRSFWCGALAGRQVDLAPLPDAGGDGRGREPRRGPARRRGRPGHGWCPARHGRGAGAHRRRQLAGVGCRRGGARGAREYPGHGQCRHRRPAVDGPPGRPRLHQLPQRRCLLALPADASGDRALGPHGRELSRPQRRSAAAGADRPHRPAADRLREPGGLGPGQVRRDAGWAACAGRHHGDRAPGLARPQ